MGRHVLVVGCGLIGGSIGLALRAGGRSRVSGYDLSSGTVARAQELGAVDDTYTDLAAGCASADLVVIATPVGQILPTVERVAAAARDGAVVTDVGSTKEPITDPAEALLAPSRHFVGGHPMAGSEREGIDAARADLFHGALWILTPTTTTDPHAYRTVHAVVQSLGARTLAMEPAEHDKLVALISHLPYALATSLMALATGHADDRVFAAAAGSFRDVTRTAGSNPDVWRDILSANRQAVLDQIDAFSSELHTFRDALDRQDWPVVEAAILRARDGRRKLPLKGDRGPGDPVTLEIPVPDRAGVLAEITTALGALGINIEDLRVEHAGAGGVVQVVLDRADVRPAATMLADRGYRVIEFES